MWNDSIVTLADPFGIKTDGDYLIVAGINVAKPSDFRDRLQLGDMIVWSSNNDNDTANPEGWKVCFTNVTGTSSLF